MSSSKQGGIGYVLRKFPVLSETFILNEILALEARGIPIHIFAIERPNDPRFHEDLPRMKAQITYLPNPWNLRPYWQHQGRAAKRYGTRYWRALAYVLGQANPELAWRFFQSAYVANHARRLGLTHLHSHFANRPTTLAHFASWLTGIPYSFTAHAVDIYREPIRPRALARKIEKARFVVTVSDYNKRFLENIAGGPNGRIVRVWNGINLTRFIPNGKPAAKPFTILSVSRFVEKKGLPTLVEACRRLRERKLDFQCWLVGTGPQRDAIEAQIRETKLGNHVKVLGPRTQAEVLRHYQAAHLYVLPCQVAADGNRDGLPVSIVEALACGLPVISTAVTGIPEVVQDGENGLLVPEKDPAALAAAIESLIENPVRYEQLRARTRSSVEPLFDQQRTADELQRLFNGAAS